MKVETTMKIKNLLFVTLFTSGWAYGALAAVSPSQAQQLGTTLTPFGAQQAGSADGAIPPYTGGIVAMQNLPTGNATSRYPDPFANERPLFSITASNAAQYAAELTPGTHALFSRFSDFRIDVYPTHRTMSYPDWVLKNSIKNATSAQMVGDSDGVTGAYGGVPFPIPQNGNEVMWNSNLAYAPAFCTETYQNYLVDTSGSVTDLGTITSDYVEPYYDSNATALPKNFYRYVKVDLHSPVNEAGSIFLIEYPVDFTKTDDITWFYSPGTRRVRMAPEFKYDTPVASYGGAIDWDEIEMFYGRMDKFDYHLVGEKEMVVPYNDYKFANTTVDGLLGPHTLNPDGVRWERHRVWVVDATLKSGERHIYSRWTFYVDEDSWRILASESYDHSGAFYRVGFAYPNQNYADTGAVSLSRTFGFYDLSKGDYQVAFAHTRGNGFLQCSTTLPNMNEYTPETIGAEGIR
jgi:hypothetical protein